MSACLNMEEQLDLRCKLNRMQVIAAMHRHDSYKTKSFRMIIDISGDNIKYHSQVLLFTIFIG